MQRPNLDPHKKSKQGRYHKIFPISNPTNTPNKKYQVSYFSWNQNLFDVRVSYKENKIENW